MASNETQHQRTTTSARVLRIAPGVSALWEGSAWRITGVTGVARLVPDATLLDVMSAFATPATLDEAASRAPHYERAAFDGAVRALSEMNALVDADMPLPSVAAHDVAFHVRARAGRIREDASARVAALGKRATNSSTILQLPPPTSTPALDVNELHRRRRSRRSSRALTLDRLSLALFTAFVESGKGRPHPSAGALHSVTPHVVARDGGVAGLARGIHRYDADAHALSPLAARDGDVSDILERARVAAELKELPAVVVLFVCALDVLDAKYENIAYALALKETGAMMMSLAIAAAFADVDACPLGAGVLALGDGPNELVVGEMILAGRA